MIKGIQLIDHAIKIVNFADNTPIFLRRNITCLNRIQVILKLYENAKINELNYNLPQIYFFQKVKPLLAGAYKKRTDHPGQLEQSQFH